MERFRPGKLAKQGLGHADLAALNPGLIYYTITAHTETAPPMTYRAKAWWAHSRNGWTGR